jgi:hypothetical protein
MMGIPEKKTVFNQIYFAGAGDGRMLFKKLVGENEG